jgi:hypothetical protein
MEGVSGVMKHLTRRTAQNKYLFVGELLAGGRDFKPKMVCVKKFLIIIFLYITSALIFSPSVYAAYTINLNLSVCLYKKWKQK